MAAVRHLGFVWDNLRKHFHGGYAMYQKCNDRLILFKLCLNFLLITLESPIHGPKILVFGDVTQNLGYLRSDPKEAHPCAECHVLTARWSRLDEPCSSIVYIQAFPIGENSGKFRGHQIPHEASQTNSTSKKHPLPISLEYGITASVLQCNPGLQAEAGYQNVRFSHFVREKIGKTAKIGKYEARSFETVRHTKKLT